ncbi:MAG: hypothetical protein WAV95_15820 [Azonexus sp.]
MALLDDGPLLEARLREVCTAAGGNIFQAESLAGVKESAQVTPALHLVLGPYRPTSNDGTSSTIWETIWFVVAVVKNQRQGKGAKAVREDSGAGLLLQQAIAALDGWQCPGTIDLVHAVPPPPPLITAGFGYFPLAFETKCVTDGAPFTGY